MVEIPLDAPAFVGDRPIFFIVGLNDQVGPGWALAIEMVPCSNLSCRKQTIIATYSYLPRGVNPALPEHQQSILGLAYQTLSVLPDLEIEHDLGSIRPALPWRVDARPVWVIPSGDHPRSSA